jgi:hypothetical protein
VKEDFQSLDGMGCILFMTFSGATIMDFWGVAQPSEIALFNIDHT